MRKVKVTKRESDIPIKIKEEQVKWVWITNLIFLIKIDYKKPLPPIPFTYSLLNLWWCFHLNVDNKEHTNIWIF